MAELPSLQSLREQIDQIDQQLIELVSRRARCAQQVAEVKQQAEGGQGVRSPEPQYYRPEREAQILRRVMARNPGPLRDEEMARLFRELMSACLALEKPLSVAFAGGEGNFAHAATLKHFGRSVHAYPHPGVEDVFREVEAGQVHYGLVPVETSREGVLGPTLDVFLRSPLRICGEVQVRTHHHLLTPEGLEINQLSRVFALPWVVSSCRLWLDEHLPGIERVSANSYAEAARRCMADTRAAVVGGLQCAEVFQLSVAVHNIEDHPNQTARYLVIGQPATPPSGRDKTSLLITIQNQAGALHRMLEPLSRHGVSLTRVDSRPSPLGDRRCHFFIDVLGHETEAPFQEALQELEPEVIDLRILGSYPEAVL